MCENNINLFMVAGQAISVMVKRTSQLGYYDLFIANYYKAT